MVFEIKLRKKQSFEYLHNESVSAELHMGVAMPGLGCCSNATHRLGKYHALSIVEVPENVGSLLLLPGATSYQTTKPDIGSGLWPS